MIEVENLRRTFAGITAVDGISFSVDRGQIIGFLGPNGAGKTTTLRILSCYMPASSGTARIAGFDVHQRSLEVRRRIGYLPENAPLYGEMRIDEYLRYRAAIKGVPRNRVAESLEKVLERVGVKDHRRRIIGQLSKGYRQRVGLADALIHDPSVLLLDEPTSGLDPNQVREMRDTIRALGAEKTVLLSSHILPEVEAVCTGAVVIHRGKIVAQGKLEDLKRGMKGSAPLHVEGKGAETDEIRKALSEVPGVSRVHRSGKEGAFEVGAEQGTDVQERIFRLFADRGWVLLSMVRKAPTLEEIFWKTTAGADLPAEKTDGGKSAGEDAAPGDPEAKK
jgi:ABC-2 type transport system ATP-binding protein